MIAALLPCSFIDFPGELAAVIFTQGCNLRCRYCHNPALCPEGGGARMALDDLLAFLDRRRGRLTGVTISGGEPTLHTGLPKLLETIRARGFATKLDTNGMRPEIVNTLCRDGLLCYLAVDVKVAPGIDATWLTGAPRQGTLAAAALGHAVARGVTCEARTTVVRGHHTAAHLAAIARSLSDAGVRTWRLQPVTTGRWLDTTVSFAPPEPPLLADATRHAKTFGIDAAIRYTALEPPSPPPRFSEPNRRRDAPRPGAMEPPVAFALPID